MTEIQMVELIDSWENLQFLISEIIEKQENYSLLLKIALYGKEPKSWRAAWLMDKINDLKPELIIPYIPVIIEHLKIEKNDSKKRHLLKLVSLHQLPAEYTGFLTDFSIELFTSSKAPIAVRVHAMQVLYNIAVLETELKPEIILIMEHEMENHGSAGIVSRCSKLLKKLRYN